MAADVVDITSKAREAWDEFVRACNRAQITMDFEDGLAAGRAWRTFLNLFSGSANQTPMDPQVLRYPYQERR